MKFKCSNGEEFHPLYFNLCYPGVFGVEHITIALLIFGKPLNSSLNLIAVRNSSGREKLIYLINLFSNNLNERFILNKKLIFAMRLSFPVSWKRYPAFIFVLPNNTTWMAGAASI